MESRKDMSILRNHLAPKEKVIDRIADIKLKETSYDCAITDHRIILFKKDKKPFIDIDFESITQFSLEKEWYNEFFLGAGISLILGLIWLISGSIYQFIDDPLIMPQIGVIRALLYPGIIFTCVGMAALYIYYTRMKIHVLIQTSKETHQLFSSQDHLDNLVTVYNLIKSGEIATSGGTIPEISDEQRMSEKPITTYNDINAKITFKDEKAQKQSINLKFTITLTQNFMQLLSKSLLIYIKSALFEKSMKGKKVPLITEENIFNLFEIAKELHVKWVLLTNFNLALQKISLQNNHFLTGAKDLDSILLKVESSIGQIVLELKKSRLFTSAPAQEIVELEKILKNY